MGRNSERSAATHWLVAGRQVQVAMVNTSQTGRWNPEVNTSQTCRWNPGTTSGHLGWEVGGLWAGSGWRVPTWTPHQSYWHPPCHAGTTADKRHVHLPYQLGKYSSRFGPPLTILSLSHSKITRKICENGSKKVSHAVHVLIFQIKVSDLHPTFCCCSEKKKKGRVVISKLTLTGPRCNLDTEVLDSSFFKTCHGIIMTGSRCKPFRNPQSDDPAPPTHSIWYPCAQETKWPSPTHSIWYPCAQETSQTTQTHPLTLWYPCAQETKQPSPTHSLHLVPLCPRNQSNDPAPPTQSGITVPKETTGFFTPNTSSNWYINTPQEVLLLPKHHYRWPPPWTPIPFFWGGGVGGGMY